MKGLYQKRLRRIFSLVAMVTSLLVIIMGSLFYGQLRKNEAQTKQLASFSQTQYINSGFSLIFAALEDLRTSPAMETWKKSKRTQDFYFNSIALWDKIKAASSSLGMLDFEFAVTSNLLDGITLTRNGSTSRELFFQKETSLTSAQQKEIIAFSSAAKNPTSPLLLPSYSAEGLLQELYIVISAGDEKTNPVIITKIFVPSLFPTEKGIEYGIATNSNAVIYGKEDPKTIADINILANATSEYPFTLFRNGFYGSAGTIVKTNWRLFLAIPSPFAGIGWPFFMLLLIFSLSFFLSVFFFLRTAEDLYRPFQQVVQEQAHQEKNGVIDEFAVIRNNGQKMRQLSLELEQAAAVQAALRTEHEALSLLEGIQEMRDEADTTPYHVACIDMDDVQDSPLLPFQLEAEASLDPEIIFVRFSSSLSVLIIKELGKETVIKKLRALLNTSQLQASLSSCVRGKQNISKAFIQAQHILEYRHTYPNNRILFPEDVISIDDNKFFYPLALEKRFLQAMLLGTGQVEAIIQEISEENFKTHRISRLAQQNLTFAIAGTIGRALQELKATTLSLYGFPTDWGTIYASAKDPSTLDVLFSIAKRITQTMKERGTTNDAKMLTMMRNYIEKHYDKDIMLQDLADQFNITAKYCGKLFSELSNDTFKNYLNAYRINIAKEKILQNPHIKINDLAICVGFNSATSFIRVFNRYVGISPKMFADNTIKKDYHENNLSLD